MDKRRLHHYWTKIRPVDSRYFLIISLVLLVIGVAALRHNNIQALKLRDEVLTVDKQNGDVEAALRKLREYVHSHMNTGLGGSNIQQPVQLKYRYERLLTAEKERVSAANERIYHEAQIDCERRFPEGLSGRGRVPCIEEYVSSHSIKEQPIPDSLYKFDFAAPRWSPDIAGISLMLSAVFFLLFLSRWLLDRYIHRRLSEHM